MANVLMSVGILPLDATSAKRALSDTTSAYQGEGTSTAIACLAHATDNNPSLQ